MKLRDLSIRSKLLFILLSMVVIPTVLLGILSYNTVQKELTDNIQKELIASAQNWQTITYAYVQQEDRVLKREQALVEQRLKTSALTAKNTFEYSASNASIEGVYTELSKIKIGRAGYVFVLDAHGVYKLSKNRLRDGENIREVVDDKGTKNIQNLITHATTLGAEDAYTTAYQWKEVGDTKARDQLVVVAYSKKYNLIFGVAMYHSDFKSEDLKLILRDELRSRMSEQKIKGRGYVWAMNSQGEYLVSKDKLRDGENIFEFKDKNGALTIREIIADAKKLSLGQTFSKNYAWKNVGEEAPRDQLTVFTYVPEWDWIIGASAYRDDYLKGLSSIRFYIFIVCTIAIILGTIIAYIFAFYITRPIKELEGIALKASAGDYNIKVNGTLLEQGSEIGSLSRSFNAMITRLFANINQLDDTNKKIAESSRKFQEKNNELERLNKLMIDRELKMIELKKRITELENH